MYTQSIVQLQKINIYQGAKLILKNVDLNIDKGEFTYLLGKTGSGKSSLLKVLYAALPVQEGIANVAGYDLINIKRKTIPLLRRKLGVVFQDFNLLKDRNIEQNLQFVLKATGWNNKIARKTRIAEVLEMVKLNGFQNKEPHQISGGERQRVAIARALINNPELLITDEPTGNLDPETGDDIMLILRKLTKKHNTAVIFATHEYRLLDNFPGRILRCHNQKLLSDSDLHV